MKELFTIALLFLTGCVTVPAPETVSRFCQRSDSDLRMASQSTERIDAVVVAANCRDRKNDYEAATRTVRGTQREASVDSRFIARKGNEATHLVYQETRGYRGLEQRSVIRRRFLSGWTVTLSSGLTIGQ